jgi:glycosyltransferase involved in cell wall biosynthesis
MVGGASPPVHAYDLSIIVPAFNEEARIAGTLDSILRVSALCPATRVQVLVIDDGSSDGTAAIVESYAEKHPGFELLRNPRNVGLGSTLRIGIAAAAGTKLLIVPGDNDLPESTLLVLIRNSHNADLVMCYFVNRELRGRARNFLSTLFGLTYTTCFDIYPEYINGPSVYPVVQLRRLKLVSTRFSIVAEINVKLLRQGVSFLEVPSHRQVGMAGSSSFSLRNLWETGSVFISLLYEIYVRNPSLYRNRPTRVVKEQS